MDKYLSYLSISVDPHLVNQLNKLNKIFTIMEHKNNTVMYIIIALVVLGLGFWIAQSRGSTSDSMATKDAQSNKTMQENDKGVLVGGAYMVRNLDIVDNAVNADNVTTLVAAVKAAGLVETLKSEGPFTVFAPTNDAFAKLPTGTVETLLKPENKEKLVSILTYHVVAGRYTSADLKDGMMLKTVQGQEIKISMKDGKWWVNNAEILIPDVISSNGVTFVVDTVLLPQ